MTSKKAGEQAGDADDDRPWRILDDEEQRQWALQVAGDVKVDRNAKLITVASQCPICDHGFWQTISADNVYSDWALRRSDRLPQEWSGDIRFTVACTCTEPHPGRPPDLEHGCGAGSSMKDTPD